MGRVGATCRAGVVENGKVGGPFQHGTMGALTQPNQEGTTHEQKIDTRRTGAGFQASPSRHGPAAGQTGNAGMCRPRDHCGEPSGPPAFLASATYSEIRLGASFGSGQTGEPTRDRRRRHGLVERAAASLFATTCQRIFKLSAAAIPGRPAPSGTGTTWEGLKAVISPSSYSQNEVIGFISSSLHVQSAVRREASTRRSRGARAYGSRTHAVRSAEAQTSWWPNGSLTSALNSSSRSTAWEASGCTDAAKAARPAMKVSSRMVGPLFCGLVGGGQFGPPAVLLPVHIGPQGFAGNRVAGLDGQADAQVFTQAPASRTRLAQIAQRRAATLCKSALIRH